MNRLQVNAARAVRTADETQANASQRRASALDSPLSQRASGGSPRPQITLTDLPREVVPDYIGPWLTELNLGGSNRLLRGHLIRRVHVARLLERASTFETAAQANALLDAETPPASTGAPNTIAGLPDPPRARALELIAFRLAQLPSRERYVEVRPRLQQAIDRLPESRRAAASEALRCTDEKRAPQELMQMRLETQALLQLAERIEMAHRRTKDALRGARSDLGFG